MQEYLVTIFGNNDNRSIRLGYLNGSMVSVKLVEGQVCNDTELRFLFAFAANYVQEADLLANNGRTLKVKFKVQIMATDLSFKAFWDAYGYKVGNKAATEKLWNALNEDEKHQCLAGTKRYNQFIARNYQQQKAYAETFLRQERWKNEYNV